MHPTHIPYLQLLHLFLQTSNLGVLLPEHSHLLQIQVNLHKLAVWPLDLGPHCLQLLQQLLSRGSLSWSVAETLVYQLNKRVLLSHQYTEWLDVVPPTLHLRPGQEVIWILRVWICGREKGAWKNLGREMICNNVPQCTTIIMYALSL